MSDEDAPSGDESRMTMIEHLTELRRRLIIAFASVGIGAIIAWIFYPQIIEFLLEPYCRTLEAGEECQLYVRNPLEPFSVRLTVAGYGGIIVAMPMILWQFWAFVAPGLYSHEALCPALRLGRRGALLRRCRPGLLEYRTGARLSQPGRRGGLHEPVRSGRLPRLRDQMIVAFGVAFEFPIVLIFLQILGILDYRTLVSSRQYAIVGIVVLVAFITPSGDPFTLMILSVPMWLFYEISIAFGYLRKRRSRKAAKAS